MKEFDFIECLEIKELLGRKADNELHLMEMIEEAPADSIYYHTHSYFLRHFYLSGQYPNDFANWTVLQVRDRVLGEKLGSITPAPGKGIEEIRSEIIDIMDAHLSSLRTVPAVIQGEPFYFMKSRIIKVPTGKKAGSLDEFIKVLSSIHASAIYFHMFEARIRIKKGKSDFSIWLEEVLGLGGLADKIEKIDCYMYSLEQIRRKIVELCQKELKK